MKNIINKIVSITYIFFALSLFLLTVYYSEKTQQIGLGLIALEIYICYLSMMFIVVLMNKKASADTDMIHNKKEALPKPKEGVYIPKIDVRNYIK